MKDTIEKLSCGSLIQHGTYNNRIYLLSASNTEIYSLPERLIAIAREKGYGKIFGKLNEIQSLPFISQKYIIEARALNMYPHSREGLFLAYYIDDERKNEDEKEIYEKNLKLARCKKGSKTEQLDMRRFSIRTCRESDIPSMTSIYKTVFPTYPFPIHDENYLLKTMKENVNYYCIESNDEIIALSSAEKDMDFSYVEMTDFATLPDWRGNGLAVHLLRMMGREMKKQGLRYSFTIARAASPGMNITFARRNYTYGGRLKNNTNISGKIQSMNVWYKTL